LRIGRSRALEAPRSAPQSAIRPPLLSSASGSRL
jgi:hypothetical protein